jgi:hypothetical protein
MGNMNFENFQKIVTDIAKTKKAKNNKTGATMDICPKCAEECGVK